MGKTHWRRKTKMALLLLNEWNSRHYNSVTEEEQQLKPPEEQEQDNLAEININIS